MKYLKSIIIRRFFIITIGLFSIISPVWSQSEEYRNLPQFLFPDFAKSVVRMKAGKDLTLMLNYNVITEKLVFLQKGKVYDLVNPEAVDTAIINSQRFVPVGKVFHEVLLEGPVNLYIQYKGKIVDPGKPAGYGGTSQVSSSTYYTRLEMGSQIFNMKLAEDLIVKTESIYWIKVGDTVNNFENERQFIKIFPEKEAEIKKYIKQNRLKFDNIEDVKRIVQAVVK